jgi:hypothetical protein
MDHLEAPHHQAGVRAEGHDRVRPPVVALAGAAPVVGARAAGGDEDEPALRVDREGRPRVARAGARSRLARPGNRVPGPAERAAAGVEAPHDATLHVDGAIVADRGADHDHVAAHRGGRRHLVVAEVAEIDAAGQIDLAAGAEPGARRAVVGVERDEARVERAHEDPGAARARARRRVPPRRHPARGDLRVAVRAIEGRVVLPELGPGARIERDRVVVGRAEEQLALDQDRGGLEGGLAIERGAPAERAGPERPRDLEPVDVRPVDLRRGGVAGPAGVVAVVRPRRVGIGLRARDRGEQDPREGGPAREPRPPAHRR